MDKVRVGTRVRHNNLVCIVTKVKGSDCELQPVGSNSRYYAPLKQVTVIMNEGTTEAGPESALYD